jgi:peptidyl-dipeptidase A
MRSLRALGILGSSLAVIMAFALSTTAQNNQEKDPDPIARADRFIEYYLSTVRPLEIESYRRWWDANISGKEEDFAKKQAAEEKLDRTLADPERFAELKAIRAAGRNYTRLARQIDILYLGYLAKQVPVELLQKMTARSNAVERKFNVFRPKIGGREVTDNDVRTILRESHDSAERRAAWEASKKVGREVLGDLKELIALRNQAARRLGFPDYYDMQLFLGEQDRKTLLKLFDELDDLTREPFHRAKAELDAALAKNCGIRVDELRPWHYHDPFFQEPPAVLGELPEAIYKKIDIVKTCRAFYDGIDLPVDDVLARSDLYEKPGKCPHAFSQDFDREGDVRILENVVPGQEWLATTLHELGHSAYSKYVPRPLPYILRTDAHPLCTEGVAIMFERFAQNVDWLQAMGVEVRDIDRQRAAVLRLQRNFMLIFARYCQVMVRFEMEMYRNPDQDLNRLWWDLAEKYQEIRRPEGRDEPDYAAKFHLVGAPVYYHNYMLGEMFASQVHHALIRALAQASPRPSGERPGVRAAAQASPRPLGEGSGVRAAIYVGNRAAGEFMKNRVFAPGMTLPWNELTRHATGEPLNAKAFAEDIGIADK